MNLNIYKSFFLNQLSYIYYVLTIVITLQYLNVVNVGDSGFMLFRNGNMIYKSSIQQYFFNCPYQLGKSNGCDDPSIAKVTNLYPIMSLLFC